MKRTKKSNNNAAYKKDELMFQEIKIRKITLWEIFCFIIVWTIFLTKKFFLVEWKIYIKRHHTHKKTENTLYVTVFGRTKKSFYEFLIRFKKMTNKQVTSI